VRIMYNIQQAIVLLTNGLTQVGEIIGGIIPKILEDRKKAEILEMRNRIKFFSITIKETFWGKQVIYTMRDRPLTEKQLDNMSK